MQPVERLRISYRGIVQGVGFRPAVYRCALELGLAGFVQNRRSWVVVEVQGPAGRVHLFRERLRTYLPASARIDEERAQEVANAPEAGFRIEASAGTDYSFPPIPPDLALCADCRRELLDPADRRFLYPFITCTQCGPRYSILVETPFDRGSTSMADFPQCPACLGEYADPASRRFHSQTNSCPACGPRLALLDDRGRPADGDPVVAAAAALEAGGIVAVQGVGGFHLAADPRRPAALQRLRRDKERARRPLALMVRDAEAASRLCVADRESLRELESSRAPILILPKADPSRFPLVSDTGTLGIMLPYSPLHLLLFRHPLARVSYDCLVMTSGNLKDEPMLTRADDAVAKLAGIADLFLCHNRRILHRADDSVLRPPLPGGGDRRTCQIRRSRGYVPELIPLVRELGRTVLALGGDLKNAPALGRGASIHLAPYVGDLENPAALADFDAHIARLLDLYGVEPDLLAYDPHPRYRSREWALASRFPTRVAVQHHHAHLLSVMAEHGLSECVGLSFDGTGYGSDGALWGGEFLRATRASFERLGHFAAFPLLGGEAAVRRPIRIAAGLLAPGGDLDLLQEIPEADRVLLSEMAAGGVHAPLSTSLGRIFDAAAALLGLVDEVSYEGEGPIRLEGLATAEWRRRGAPDARGLIRLAAGAPFRLDSAPLIAHLARRRGRDAAAALALLVHVEVAAASLAGAEAMRSGTGLSALALSGGVFQNVLLRALLLPLLERAGFAVYLNERVPPGDGGLAVGQAWYEP